MRSSSGGRSDRGLDGTVETGRTGSALPGTLATVAMGLLAAACAREEAPPGNLPDTRPPQIVTTRPESGAVVPGFDESLRIQFDEPVNVSRSYLRGVEVSPAWRLRTDFGFSDIRLRPEEGWRDGVVYTFRFPPDLADILGNRREEAFGLRFSTGPPIFPTRASGRLLRRVDGTGIRDGRVIFFSAAGDSVPYSAVSDTGGVFELEALPPGSYTAWGFEDLNANLRLDRLLEPYDSVDFQLPDSTSAARIALHVVEPDTTPPVLASAEALDSVTVRLEFDDPLEPGQDTTVARIAVTDTATGRPWPVESWAVGRLEAEPDTATGDTLPSDTTVTDSVPLDAAAVRDSAAIDTGGVADTLAPDTAAVEDTPAVDTTEAEGPGGAGDRPGMVGPPSSAARGDSLPLPSREVTIRLGRPLEVESVYRVRAEGFRNLRKLSGGGDTTFVYEAVQDTATADTLPSDTTVTDSVPSDTTVTDSVAVDTAAVRDSTPPDTVGSVGGGGKRR